jgi:glycosyltransferase involved in cell wall biosynthesis
MKILVFAHRLDMGGSQMNAIELSATLRDTFGHDVVLFASPGPMVEPAVQKGLRFIAVPPQKRSPSIATIRLLRDVLLRERPEVMHIWDWWQCPDSFYGAHLRFGIPMVVSDMIVGEPIPELLPRTLLTTFGTRERVNQARAVGRKKVELLLPPVDIEANKPNVVNTRGFCERNRIRADELKLVIVSRLAVHLKGEGLARTIDAVRILGRDLPLRLVIAGDGDARSALHQLAIQVNAELGRDAVTLVGEQFDPRPAYAAADIVIGMGGSALRGAAFGKPVIVIGERGFSAPLTPETAPFFHYIGMYGLGDGSPSNARLIGDIRALAHAGDNYLSELGTFSRQFVLQHFTLEKIAAQLETYLRAAIAEPPQFAAAATEGLRISALLFKSGRFAPDIVRRLAKNAMATRTQPPESLSQNWFRHVADPSP